LTRAERLLLAVGSKESTEVRRARTDIRQLNGEVDKRQAVAEGGGKGDDGRPSTGTHKTPGPLVLRNGVAIEDPLADALAFIELDGTYQRYDTVVVDPWDLSEADVQLANAIIARMGAPERAAVLSRREQVRGALRAIPPTTSLTAPAHDVPWVAVRRLFAALDGLPGIALARATKVLHKKRPALVPILDEVVVGYLEGVEGTPLVKLGSLAETGTGLTRAYHRELQLALPVLAWVREELAGRGFQLTECRLLDIYLWAYSGTYEPLWLHRGGTPGGAGKGSVTPKPPPRPGG
jgi:hypothetical protein